MSKPRGLVGFRRTEVPHPRLGSASGPVWTRTSSSACRASTRGRVSGRRDGIEPSRRRNCRRRCPAQPAGGNERTCESIGDGNRTRILCWRDRCLVPLDHTDVVTARTPGSRPRSLSASHDSWGVSATGIEPVLPVGETGVLTAVRRRPIESRDARCDRNESILLRR